MRARSDPLYAVLRDAVVSWRRHERQRELGRAIQRASEQAVYIFSSRLFAEVAQVLRPGPDEELVFIEGFRLGAGIYVASRIVGLQYDSQSIVGVHADQRSIAKALEEMDEHGQLLVGIFHSHPGTGLLSILPSGTDKATQERYERGGSVAISAIVSRDERPLVRFFGVHNRHFKVWVCGRGVRQRSEHVFEIEPLRDVPVRGRPVVRHVDAWSR